MFAEGNLGAEDQILEETWRRTERPASEGFRRRVVPAVASFTFTSSVTLTYEDKLLLIWAQRAHLSGFRQMFETYDLLNATGMTAEFVCLAWKEAG